MIIDKVIRDRSPNCLTMCYHFFMHDLRIIIFTFAEINQYLSDIIENGVSLSIDFILLALSSFRMHI